MNNVILDSIMARKSVRVFEEREIPADVRDMILTAAFQAPTGGNQMLYSILEITEQEKKQRLSVLCDNQPFIATAPMVLVFVADCRRWLDSYRAAGIPARMPQGGDLLLAVCDCVIAAQNAVVAAESLGLGSCYIGDILENCEAVRDLLKLPRETMPAAMLVLGYPTEQQRTRKKPARFDRSYVVMENEYRLFSPEEHIAAHKERAAREGKADFDYDRAIQAFYKRKYGGAFVAEMNRSVQAYLSDFINCGKERRIE